jgi:hypothetical protein
MAALLLAACALGSARAFPSGWPKLSLGQGLPDSLVRMGSLARDIMTPGRDLEREHAALAERLLRTGRVGQGASARSWAAVAVAH